MDANPQTTFLLWSEAERADARRYGTFSSCIPTLTYMPPSDPSTHARGAVIICPGGGYAMKAPHEGAPVALRLAQSGFHAFVLDYRVYPDLHPAPLSDVRRAIRMVRDMAPQRGICSDRIAILGFSAGGHLAGTAAFCCGGVPGMTEALSGPDIRAARPDAAILCYPVQTLGERTHADSRANLLGEDPDPALIAALSCERAVDAGAPPTFLWHTAEDASVPVAHSLHTAEALAFAGVPFELHVYPQGRHGLGLADGFPPVSDWSAQCIAWLRRLGY